MLTRYGRDGPSSRLRHLAYVPALERVGFRVTVAPFFDDDYLATRYGNRRLGLGRLARAYGRRLRHLLNAHRYDLLWIEKEALPWLPAAFESVLRLRPFVVDFDDAWYLSYAQHSTSLVRVLLGGKLETIVQHATNVIAGNRHLAEWATSSGAGRVVELPTVVDTSRYPVLPLPDGPFTIAWIGTPHSAKYLASVAEPLRHLQTNHGARLVVIGAGADDLLPGLIVDRRRWSEDTEAAELTRCHVGIMPLADGPWERGKCGYKLIQYMAAGRPVVGSRLGSNKSIVRHGQTGFLAGGAQEWTDSLAALASDRDAATRMGLAGRKRVEEMYSLEVAAPRLVEILQEAVSSRAKSSRQRARARPGMHF